MAFSKTSKLKPRHTDLMQYVIFYINVAFEFSIFFPNQPPWFESTDMKKPIISGQILHSENGNFRYFSKCIIREARLQLVLISHVYLYMECSIHLVWTYAFILKKKAAILNGERLSINVGLGRKTESAITLKVKNTKVFHFLFVPHFQNIW